MCASTIGHITLNLSFILYLVVYIPQVQHNKHQQHIAELSVGLHMILTTSFALDLIYSFLKPLPWQYRTVSCLALCLLSIQQKQLVHYARKHNDPIRWFMLNLFSLVVIILLAGFFYTKTTAYTTSSILMLGWLSRIGFLSYTLPQIIHNYRLKSAQALNATFLYLSLLLSLLDLVSAWSLNWGWPNKLGTPFTITLTLSLLWQKKHYSRAIICTKEQYA